MDPSSARDPHPGTPLGPQQLALMLQRAQQLSNPSPLALAPTPQEHPVVAYQKMLLAVQSGLKGPSVAAELERTKSAAQDFIRRSTVQQTPSLPPQQPNLTPQQMAFVLQRSQMQGLASPQSASPHFAPTPMPANTYMQTEISRLQALQHEALKIQSFKRGTPLQQRQMLMASKRGSPMSPFPQGLQGTHGHLNPHGPQGPHNPQGQLQSPLPKKFPTRPLHNSGLLPAVNTYAPRLRIGETALIQPLVREEPRKRRFAEEYSEDEADKNSERDDDSSFQNSNQESLPLRSALEQPGLKRTLQENPINPKRTRMLRTTKHEYDKLYPQYN